MKEKIIAFLKTKLSGVPENYLLGVAEHFSKTVTKETEIETTFTDGVIDLLKLNAGLLQSEGDKRVTEATKTALKNFQDKHGLNEDGTPIKKETKKKKDESDPDEPGWFKTYREQKDIELLELKTKLDAHDKEKLSEALIGKVKAHEKLKGIPAWYLKKCNLTPNSEGEIDQLATSLETDWNSVKQEMAEQGTIISVPPAAGSTVKEGEALGKTIAEKRNANSSDGVKGKELTTKK